MTAFWITLRIVFQVLMGNKIRSALTMLGIIIGVGAVIVMVSVGLGARAEIVARIASMGSNLLIVESGSITSGGVRTGSGGVPTLSVADAEAIVAEVSAVKNVAPYVYGVAQVIYGNENWSTFVTGTVPEMLEIRDWPVALGHPFTDRDVKGAAKVCLLGKTVADNLFGWVDPIGQTVRIKKVPLVVIGVLSAKGQSTSGSDRDDTVIVPLQTAQKRLFGMQFPGMVKVIIVQVKESGMVKEAEDQINALLRQRHRMRSGQPNDFTIRNLSEVMASAEQSGHVMSLLLGAIASISLIVGGIGIMNVMLISVKERTREIGIRIAAGATTRDILLQFLTESMVLSLFGGTLGIAAGIAGTHIFSILTQWPTLLSVKAILLAFLFAGCIGIFFGFYPARKASLLDPIEALRFE